MLSVRVSTQRHRTIEATGRHRHDDVFGVEPVLRTEPAADVRCDHPDLVRLETERHGETVAGAVGALVLGPLREVFAAVERSDHSGARRTRFERARCDSWIAER